MIFYLFSKGIFLELVKLSMSLNKLGAKDNTFNPKK